MRVPGGAANQDAGNRLPGGAVNFLVVGVFALCVACCGKRNFVVPLLRPFVHVLGARGSVWQS